MARMTITHLSIAELRDMIANGLDDGDIQAVNDDRADAAIEAQAADDDYHQRYGDDYNDDTREYGAQAAYNDRLDMGRNDAGEWLGFC